MNTVARPADQNWNVSRGHRLVRLRPSFNSRKISLCCGTVDSNAVQAIQNLCMGAARATFAELCYFAQQEAFPGVIWADKNRNRRLEEKI